MALNAAQLRAIASVGNGNNVVIAGAAGTGKSHLIKAIVDMHPSALVTAMTGNAAVGVNGKTLHSALGIGLANGQPSALARRNSEMAPLIRSAKIIVVDEASMMSASLFEFVDAYLRTLLERHSTLWGGLQVVLVGDMLQLPPVADPASLERNKFFFESGAFEAAVFDVIVLTENFRQSGDGDFQQLLSRVAMGTPSDQDIEALKTCVKPVEDKTSMHIFNTRSNVASHNSRMLAALKGDPVCYKRTFNAVPLRTAYASRIQHLVTKAIAATATRFEEVLSVKVGARVMTTANVQGQYANGQTGCVTRASDDAITVKLDCGRVVNVMRMTVRTDERGLGHVTVTQFPVILAYALTAHRVQGLTLSRIVASVNHTIFSAAQAYVTLSRCRRLSDITLTSFNPAGIYALDSAKEFYKRHMSS
jgi:ATP-dependent DNA helicase PIF1